MNENTPTYNDIYGGGSHIIKFGSPTCAPCKKMTPIFSALSRDSRFKEINFWDVDITDVNNEEIVQKMSIRTAPTVICVKDGNNVRILMGANQVSKESLVNAIFETIEEN